MFTSTYFGNWDYWELYHKVTFDGANKLITINPGETAISVKQDLYSAWKEWVGTRDYAKYLPAIRTTGGDQTPTGYSGDMYFLMNGWQIVVPHEIQIDGILYHDDPIPPYIVEAGGGVIATVSNLALGGSALTAQEVRVEMDDNSSKLALIGQLPSASQIRTEMDTNSSKLTAILSAFGLIPAGVRTELTPELDKINTQVNGLTAEQLNMLSAMYTIMGLDPTKPLVVTPTSVTAGDLAQTVTGDSSQTTVTRNA